MFDNSDVGFVFIATGSNPMCNCKNSIRAHILHLHKKEYYKHFSDEKSVIFVQSESEQSNLFGLYLIVISN